MSSRPAISLPPMVGSFASIATAADTSRPYVHR